jgi:hypothetical protein
MTTLLDTPALSVAEYSYHQAMLSATFGQVEKASVWYRDAEEVAEEVARNLDTTLEVGASVVSAFSPRERWSTNVSKAIAYSLGGRPKGLQNNLAMADAAIEKGFDALKGLKTNAFARAIAGDTDAVVIDTWMVKAAGMDSNKGVNKSQYKMLSDLVRLMASEHGLTPRTTQALIWIVKRGSAS